MIHSFGGGNWGYFSYVEDGNLVIGASYPHEGGELYRGKYMGDDTPHILSLKMDDVKQYNRIVKYFNEIKEDAVVENRKRVLIFPSVHGTTIAVNYDATNGGLNTFLSAFDVWKGRGNHKLSDDNIHQEVWFEMDFDFYMLSKCDTLRKAIERFGVEVIHDYRSMN